ncbi:serine/threonine-protein kinase KIN2 [Ceratobasidium sp. 395]|nr:serine/threonine-protein kinase KIN2 [Ceratobasidium sp. 395]
MDNSVATTSTKPARITKADVKRVLNRMQVQHRKIRGGFERIHVPSIDLVSIVDSSANTDNNEGGEGTPRRSVCSGCRERQGRGGGRRWEQGEGKREGNGQGNEKEKMPVESFVCGCQGSRGHKRLWANDAGSGTTALGSTNSLAQTKSSVPRNFGTTGGSGGTGGKVAPDVVGDVSEDTVNELCVRFETSIVKLPLLPLHGVQFRRVGGDGWQY